ncbi:MAG: hypothetical protein PVG39_23490 [Desulfobacteraceae bacterium]|jgi:hypothetical protein
MAICVMPMAGISQTSDNSYDENNVNEEQDNHVFAQEKILYEILMMEADIEKEFDIGSTSVQQSIGMELVSFNNGINIDGESFENLEELLRFMDDDPDVNVLSFLDIPE